MKEATLKFEKEYIDSDRSGFIDEPASGTYEYTVPKPCFHPNHHAPRHMVIPIGKMYRHVCPGCGVVETIRRGMAYW